MRGRRDLLVGMGLSPLAAGGARAQAVRDLTVVSWGGTYQEAQRDAYFRPWMTARDARMLEETWDGGMDVLRERLRAGSHWDVVQVAAEELMLGCRENLFEPMDWEAIGGQQAYLPEAVHGCGVGSAFYAVVLAWDRGVLPTAPAGWADFFDTGRFPGRRALRQGPQATLEIALLGDGVPAAEVYRRLGTAAGQDQAFRRLETIRDTLVWWQRGAQPPQWLANGEVVLTSAANGRIAAANALHGRDFGMVWAQNLAAMGSWVILRESPNREKALDFLRFAGQPAAQARMAERIPYGVTARGAQALLPGHLQTQLPTAPAHAAQALRLDEVFWLRHLDALTRRFESWWRG